MKYVVASVSVTDEIYFSNGRHLPKVAGGAGIYALSGIRLWDDDVVLATGVGADYEELYGEWFRNNHLSMEGLIVKDEKTPHTVIRYFEDGEREETPLYGLEHFQKIEIQPEELKDSFGQAKGIYIFKNSNADFWEKIGRLKEGSASKVLWEIANDATYRENKETVKAIAQKCVDVFSVNLTESRLLLGLTDLDEIIAEYRTWGLPLVFLRRGAEGSVMITAEQVETVPAEQGIALVDPTGGGNSSTGAVLCGFCEGKDLRTIARMGNLSAAMCLAQYGVPEVITSAMREEARQKLEVKSC